MTTMEAQSIVAAAVKRGLVRFSVDPEFDLKQWARARAAAQMRESRLRRFGPRVRKTYGLTRRESRNLCMARLRAERRGLEWTGPERIVKRKEIQ